MVVHDQDGADFGAILDFCVHSDGGLIGEDVQAHNFVLIGEQEAYRKIRILANGKVLEDLYIR